jgi:outer membrane protein
MARRGRPSVAGVCVLGLSLLIAQGAALAQSPGPIPTPVPPPPATPLTLEAAVLQALGRNPQVTAAQQSLVAAQAGVVTARAGLAPTVSLTGTGSYGTSGISSSSATVPGLVGPAATPNATGAVSVTGTLPIYDSGRTHAAVEQAEAAVASAEAALKQTQQDIALSAATDFFSVLKAERTTTVREAQLAQAQQQLAQAEAQFRAGSAAQADVVQAQAQVAQAQVDLLNARNQIETTKAALRSVLGLDAQGPVEVQEPAPPAGPPALTAEAAVQEALRNRPEVAQAAAAVQSNQGALDLAYVNAGLQVSVGLGTSYVPYSSNALASNSTSYGVTATVSLPLFDSGKSAAGINAAKANLGAAQAKLEQARLAVRQDAYQAYLAAIQGAANVAATDAAQRAAAEALRVAEGRYQAGVATIVEVTTSRATAAQADVNAVNARYDYQSALATLRHAVGRSIVGGSL